MSALTKALRTALAQKLAASSSVTSIATGGIYHSVAPAQATYPLVIFNQQSNTRFVQSFGDRGGRNSLWMVKGVAVGENSDAADNLSAAIEALLNEGTLSVSGGTLYRMHWEQDVQYTELEDGEQIRHSGGMYRITYH